MPLNQGDNEIQDAKAIPRKTNGNYNFINCLENRNLGNKCSNANPLDFCVVAEDVVVQKEYKEMRCDIPAMSRATFLMVFSPDGTKMASTHGNHNIYVTDIKTGKNIKTLVGHPRTPWCITFHPTSNQIIASGCLGGQVRIWDLSGGSEIWTVESQTVIASIAFHPDDRVLVIATFNELYFWDWSKPEPFMHVTTNSVKEKVRYVAFDKLGQKLITGIANSPQARWERVRAPVPIPRQIDRTANTYRRRITPRLITNFPPMPPSQQPLRNNTARQPLSSVPERERRITQCYRNLVHEYELLVHRFLQIYRPPTMIDQGTDPMEMDQAATSNHSNVEIGPSTSGMQTTNPSLPLDGFVASNQEAGASTASTSSINHSFDGGRPFYEDVGTRRVRLLRRRDMLIRSTQTQADQTYMGGLRMQGTPNNLSIICPSDDYEPTTENASTNDQNGSTENVANGVQTVPEQNQSQSTCPLKNLLLKINDPGSDPVSQEEPSSSSYKLNIKCSPNKSKENSNKPAQDDSQASTSKETVESNRTNSSVPTWHRVVRKRTHASKKGFIPSSDSSSSDEDNSTPRRPYPHKSPSTNQDVKSKVKVQKMQENNSNERESQPSSSNTSLNNREYSTLNNQIQALYSNMHDNTVRIQQQIERLCNTCGGTIRPDQNREQSHYTNCRFSTEPSTSSASSSRGNLNNSVIEYGTHLSAFCPLRRRHLREGHVRRVPPPETADQPLNLSAFHPFDPPPDVVSIHPENIGIGNMYSNIVQELESSLNDVRSIRANNRIGETSDMLSSFSERLESIMNQSNTILRNLNTSIDTIMPNASNNQEASGSNASAESENAQQPQLLFNDSNFYVRERRAETDQERTLFDIQGVTESLDGRNSSNHTSIASDHTYPRNPRNSRNTPSPMTPLIASLHFTVSHIQRQARLLRQQVESIEHIDRAMLEVAQLQMMRQMFSEIHRHFSNLTANERNSGVSSVRQMMAGTRISDSSQQDAQRTGTNRSAGSSSEHEIPNTSASHPSNSASRTRAHKSFPRCIFLMHRQSRRPHQNLRHVSRDRSCRRHHFYRRSFPCRAVPRSPTDLSPNRGRGFLNLFNPDTLPSMTRRLEHLLMEHGRYIGQSVDFDGGVSTSTEVGEHIIMLRLNNCRFRILRVLGNRESSGPNPANNQNSNRITNNSVTRDGASRFGARQTLCSILDTLSRFVEVNTNNTLSANFRTHIWDVIELSLLLSEILLLQIVDSIPPPTGMNLDPERESLSARIDQMCSRMLQSRLSVQSHQLARSLRLMRLTVRHATQALGQTYTARRNAILPSNSDNNRRRQLLDDINNCLRNIRRHRNSSTANSNEGSSSNTMPMRNWFITINDLISRYTTAERAENAVSRRNESDEQVEESSDTSQPLNISSDSNDYNEISNNVRRENVGSLYRTSNMNLLDAPIEAPPPPSPSPWSSIPIVQVSDYSTNEVYSPWRPRPTFLTGTRERISERLSELRSSSTMGGFFRPRFLHPLFASGSPFDADLDENQREQIYDSDMISNMSPTHRIQVWEFTSGQIPTINNSLKNVVVNECKIHNDASVDIASDGSVLVTLLPGGYLNVTNKLGVYSLDWTSLGQCLYVASFEQNAVSVSLSPINRYLLVGMASRRVILPNDKWTMARVFLLEDKGATCGRLSSVRDLEQNRNANSMSVNCIRWLPISGQGVVYATNTGQLRILT